MSSLSIKRFPVVCRLHVIIIFLFSGGCATGWSPPSAEETTPFDRKQTQEQEGVRVSAAVPSADETARLFGVNLYKRGVQPVWIEVVNNREETLEFLPLSMDANYFTPVEAATMHRRTQQRDDMQAFFLANGMPRRIEAGASKSGFVFTHLDEGTKSFNIDIVGDDKGWYFTFFIEVPGLRIDHHRVDFDGMYSEQEIRDLDRASLVVELESMPCCTSNKSGKGSGDPLNLVVIGDPQDVYRTFIRAGWDETEVVTVASGLKLAVSFISGSEYRYSPVSSLYAFDRPQDIALQRIRNNIHERNHLRLWMSPFRFEGKAVWIGQISRDIGVRFSRKTITTHKIDAQVDETREYLAENLAYHQALSQMAYVDGAIPASADAPRSNLTGDPYFTDGQRIVLWVSPERVALDDIAVVDWSKPIDGKD
jgi:hypothetical protein